MNKEAPYRQKTENTRRRVGRTKIVEKPSSSGSSSLPPRGEIHQQKRKKKDKGKISFPLIRLQVALFILLPIIIFALYTYWDRIFPGQNTPVLKENSGYENITIDNTEQETNTGTTKKVNTSKEKDEAEKEVNDSKKAEVEDSGSSSVKENELNNGNNEAPNGGATIEPEPVQVPTVVPEESNQVEIKQHTVQPGETLYRIAMKYYHSKDGIEIIKNANNIQNNEIRVGQTLKIPIQ